MAVLSTLISSIVLTGLVVGNTTSNLNIRSVPSFTINEDASVNNNTFDNATSLNPPNYFELMNYQVTFNGSLASFFGTTDFDYLYFNLPYESEVNLSLSNSSSCYMELLCYDYYDLTSNAAYHIPETIFSNNHTNYYSNILHPGTYFIEISTESFAVSYSISLSIAVTENFHDIQTNKLFESGLEGCVWINDLLPANCLTFENPFGEIIYYQPSVQNLNYPDYLFDDIYNLIGEEPIEYCDFYVWGPFLRYVLFKITSTMRNTFHNLLVENEMICGQITATANAINNTLSITGLLLDLIPVNIIISFCGGIFNYVSQVIVEKIATTLSPTITLSKTEYLSFLSQLAAYLDLGITSYQENVGYISTLSPTKIIEIPLYYSLGRNVSIFSNFSNNFFTISSSWGKIFERDSLIFKDYKIDACRNTSIFCRGKFYEFDSSLNDFSLLPLVPESIYYIPHEHSLTYDDAYVIGYHMASCDCGFTEQQPHDYSFSYSWFNNTKHTAFCACGDSVKYPHAIVSGSNRCILCGGIASGGITPFGEAESETKSSTKTTENGSYIRPDGVIVLVEDDVEAFLNGELVFD